MDLEVDPITERLGKFGKWQFIILTGFGFIMFADGLHRQARIFYNKPSYKLCAPSQNLSCCTKECRNITFQDVTDEFSMNKEFMDITRSSTFYFLTRIVEPLASIIIGALSDRYGRKWYPQACAAFAQLLGILIMMTKSSRLVLLGEALLRSALAAATMTSYVFAMEIVSPGTRELVAVTFDLCGLLGATLGLTMSIFIRNWRVLQVSVTMFSFLSLVSWLSVTESPRQLECRGRKKEAHEIYKLVKRMNYNTVYIPMPQEEKKVAVSWVKITQENLVFNLVCIHVLLFITGSIVAYFYVMFARIPGDIYVNYGIARACSFISPIIFLVLSIQLYRPCAMFTLIGASCVIAWLFFALIYEGINDGIVQNAMITILYVLLRTVRTLGGLSLSECVPTRYRNVIYAVGSETIQLGAAIGRAIATVDLRKNIYMYAVGLTFSIVFTFPVPETGGKKLPESFLAVKPLVYIRVKNKDKFKVTTYE